MSEHEQKQKNEKEDKIPVKQGLASLAREKGERFYLRLSHRLPKGSPWYTILLIFLISTLLHVLFIWYLEPAETMIAEPQKQKIPVNISFKEPVDQKPRQISELRQKKTEAPEKADIYGYEDHKAEKETVATKTMASSPTGPSYLNKGSEDQEKENDKDSDDVEDDISKIVKDLKDKMTVKKKSGKPSKGRSYEDFLPNTTAMRPGRDKVTQDFMGSDFTLGSGIDVNMKAHPLMSYFSKIRQAVELSFYNIPAGRVRNYMERNNLSRMMGQSTALVQVARDGEITFVKIVDSNGHDLIDDHWRQVLIDSGPYAPIPETWKENNLRFRYKINYGYR